MSYRYSAAANRHLVEITAWLSYQANPEVADRFWECVEETALRLVEFPMSGAIIPNTRYRRTGVVRFPNHVLIYEVLGGVVRIVHILHGARNLPPILEVDDD